MQKDKRNYNLLILSIIIFMCLIIGSTYILTIHEIEGIYKEAGQEGLLDMKKVYLKDTVDNLIIRLDAIKQYEVKAYEKVVIEVDSYISQVQSSDNFISLISLYFNSESQVHLFDAIVVDNDTNEIVYSNKADLVKSLDLSNLERSIYKTYSIYSVKTNDKYRIFFGIKNRELEKIIKEQISYEIHSALYSDNSYIWVNEILDFSGGDGYAIRLIHPNLIDTEGALLSTNTTDIKGNYPYKLELEGVKSDGSVYYSYYFKKLNSNQISEKLTYSKLYAEYNWIISMGVHLDDVDTYLSFTKEQSDRHMQRLIINITILVILLTLISTFFLVFVDKWHNLSTRKALEEEILIDGLTKAYSRKAGIKDLRNCFDQIGKNEDSVAIILIDVDDFKRINDKYGHDSGDAVLNLMVESLKSRIRQSDKLYRWGGEEFLLVCQGVDRNFIVPYCEKILNYASDLNFSFDSVPIKTSVSIGVTFLERTDIDYNEALKRADIAMYHSKEKGKNQATYYYKEDN